MERHLLEAKYEKAFDLILKLRDTYSNKSFQNYSANALILTCLVYQRADLLQKFITSIDKEYELQIYPPLYILCKKELHIPLTIMELMILAKAFEFTNTRYIKNNSQLFKDCLSKILISNYGVPFLDIDSFFTTSSKKYQSIKLTLFANVSIIDNSITVPNLLENFNFKRTVCNILDTAHQHTKLALAEIRKETKKEIKPK